METLTKPSAEQPADHSADNPSSLNKLEFEGIDPRFSDIAYHFTPEENLPGIATEGLRYADNNGYGERWQNADRALMDIKPADIAVDLEHVVFGQLEQRHLGTTNGSGALRTDIEKGESIAVAIDPNDTYVGDASLREDAVRERVWDGSAKSAEIKQEFWKNVMPLTAFRELYEPKYAKPNEEYGSDEVWWTLKDPSNAEKLDINESVWKPELYIPLEAGYDTIPTERLTHTASSLAGRMESAAQVRERERKEKELRLGYLGMKLAEYYEGHQNATRRVLEAKDPDSLQHAKTRRENQLHHTTEFVTAPAYEEEIKNEAIKDANAAGHDINFGGEVYLAQSDNLSDKKAA